MVSTVTVAAIIVILDWSILGGSNATEIGRVLNLSHTTSVRVRFYELDPYDHVNHVNYLRYFETARVEFLSELGFGLDVMKDRDLAIVVVELQARFTGQAKLHDVIEVTTEARATRGAVSTWHQHMTLDGQTIAQIDIKAAFTSLEGRARRIPPEFMEKVQADGEPRT